LKKEQIEK